MSSTIERNFAGHFIGAADCRFFRTTDVDDRWRVSTVGDYRPKGLSRERTEIGYGRWYETMVFKLSPERCKDCGGPCDGAPKVAEWSEIDFQGYMTEAEALAGHAAMVEAWLNKTAEVAS